MNTPSHILITGASGAIGAALARAMRASWPAATLALVDRDEAPMRALASELSTQLAEATTYVADLRDLDALPALVDRVQENGPVDGLVNCAGVMRVQNVHTWSWDDAQQRAVARSYSVDEASRQLAIRLARDFPERSVKRGARLRM